jgi:hypothetical protein
MKKLKWLQHTSLLLLFTAMIISCKGPAGPEGPQGPQGPAGNANVISSNWITPNWVSQDYYSNSAYQYEWNVPDLTQSIYDTGVILVYWKNHYNEVRLLPFPDGADRYFLFHCYVGKIQLVFTNFSGGWLYLPPDTNKFRYVLIPQGTSSKPSNATPEVKIQYLADELAKHNVDIYNYYDVCAYLGIEP